MRTLGKWLLRLVAVLALAGAGLWAFGPREVVEMPAFDAARIGEDPAAYLAAREAVFTDIRPGEEARIVWAAEPGRRTPLVVVYFHGFSASSEEIRPVPDRVAAALGANLLYTRFAGHGRSGPDAMGEASAGDWLLGAAEAMAVARALGERVVILSTSTGGTLAALAAADPEMSQGLAGIVFVAPNFAINNPAAPILTWPAARSWVPMLFGERRSFTPRNEAQARHWTTDYPSVAVVTLAALVQHAMAQDWSAVTIPALFYMADGDQVVRTDVTREVAARWGGPVRIEIQAPGEGVDDSLHVITGDIISPATTDSAAAMIVDWIGGL